MSTEDWQPVATALLGSWPSQVASWGREALAAYLAEVQARGVDAESALVAVRSCPAEQKFPPSAPELAAVARRDPSQPTFVEAYRLIYGPRGILRARPSERNPSWGSMVERERAYDDAARLRAQGFHPLLAAFVDRYGLGRLRGLEVDHPEFGDVKRRELERAWNEFVVAAEGRDVALVAGRSRGGLDRFDPLAVLDRPRPVEIGSGS